MLKNSLTQDFGLGCPCLNKITKYFQPFLLIIIQLFYFPFLYTKFSGLNISEYYIQNPVNYRCSLVSGTTTNKHLYKYIRISNFIHDEHRGEADEDQLLNRSVPQRSGEHTALQSRNLEFESIHKINSMTNSFAICHKYNHATFSVILPGCKVGSLRELGHIGPYHSFSSYQC